MVDNILATKVTLEKSEVGIIAPPVRIVPDGDSVYADRAALAAALTALALVTGGEQREGVLLAAIAAGMKVVRR